MLVPSPAESKPRARWASGWITIILGISAIFAVGFGVSLILGREDNEALESPLILSVARQLLAGPRELYGPFGMSNPLVLIHAPLYYHTAALVAWPLTRMGLDPITAARLAGRLLSLVGLAVTALAAFRLARLDGLPNRAGWWAACLIATAPAIGVMSYSVRPDMLGVALDSTGVFLVLRQLQSREAKTRGLFTAFAAFGLAACIKQHYVVAPLVCTGLLFAAWWRGRVALGPVVRGLLVAIAVVIVVYSAEEIATNGRMSQAVFLAAAGASRVHPADWGRAWIVISAIIGRSSGLVALLAAAGLAQVAARRGLIGWLVGLAGATLIVLLFSTAVLESTRAGRPAAIISYLALWACVGIVLPACALLAGRGFLGGSLDACLWLLLSGELVVVVLLSRASSGSWINYGIQAVVWVCVLSARAIARGCEASPRSPALGLIALASLLVPVALVQGVYRITIERRRDRDVIGRIVQESGRPSSEYFFAGAPGLNRVYGRPELVYDAWLYMVFETMHLAQPRSTWLRRALTSSPIRLIVNTSESPAIDGLDETLAALGYVPSFQAGDLFVWERIR
jgi:hypothetical protein